MLTRFRAMQIGGLCAGATFVVVALSGWLLTQGQTKPALPVTASSPPALPSIAITPQPLPLPEGNENLRVTNDVRVYQAVKDAVVNITANKIVSAHVNTGNDFFDRYSGLTQLVPAQSLGSGFVIHSSGYIITNEHVVEEGTDVSCVFSNGDKLSAQVIATDNEHDLAILKVEPPQPLHAIVLGASEDLMIGEPVYAIGNPFGFAGTMTSGIISAVDRTLDISPSKSYKGLIQTNASINPGNSGGPLLNAYGQVVGVNSAIRADAHGIGFAISVSNMRDLLPAFLNPEALNHAQVGFTLEEKRTERPPANIAASVYVRQVKPGSDADKAGLKNGDLLMAVGGQPVVNIVDALVALGSAKPGETLALEVQRGGSAAKLDIKIPVTQAPPPPPSESETLLLNKLGVRAENLTPALILKHSLASQQGIYITEVQPNSPAGKAGIQSGDVLYQLGRYYVRSTDDVATLLKTVTEPVDAQIGIIRGNTSGRGTVHLQ